VISGVVSLALMFLTLPLINRGVLNHSLVIGYGAMFLSFLLVFFGIRSYREKADIGYGGLDHVLSLDYDINVLVLDTEVYSNTGGQASKATPLGAAAKFASRGKAIDKKDLGLMAMNYGHVYVASIAFGARDAQTVKALAEADAWRGPSLVIAYSHCIAHGIEMRNGLDQQYRAVASGYWPLVRYDPVLRAEGGNPFLLDSPRPRIPLADYTKGELRYGALARTDPAEAERLHALAEEAVAQHWNVYEEMATHGAERFIADARKDERSRISRPTTWG